MDPATFAPSLEEARRNGYAVNDESTEPGVLALGAPLWTGPGTPSAAISISMPTSRSSPETITEAGAALLESVGALQADLNEQPWRER